MASLASLQKCVNYIQGESDLAKSNCRHILELAAAVSTSSSSISEERPRMVRGYLNVYIDNYLYILM